MIARAPARRRTETPPAGEEATARLRAVPTPPPRERSLIARHPAAAAVVAAAGSRLLVFAVAFASSYYWGERLRHRQPVPGEVLVDRHPLGFFLSAWQHWDAVWFMHIAERGYGKFSTAFFPLYPALMRAVGLPIGGRTTVAGIIVSLACFAGALVILYRLVRDEFGGAAAAWTVILLSFVGTSFFFQAVYSESLFLLLTVASFAAARRGHWVVAGLAGGLAALTRSAGVLLVVPLAWMWVEQYRGGGLRLPGAAQARPLLARGRQRIVSLAALLLIPAGLGVYMAYLQQRFGNALEFTVAEKHWHRHLHLDLVSVWQGARAAWRSLHQIAADPGVYTRLQRLPFHDQWITMGNLTAFLALLFAVAVFVACWRRLPSAYTVFAAVALLLPLAYPTHGTPLLSFPRFVLVDFPLFIALALLVEKRPVARWALAGAFAAGLVLLTVVYANGMWVA
jgi:hypothetical protein